MSHGAASGLTNILIKAYSRQPMSRISPISKYCDLGRSFCGLLCGENQEAMKYLGSSQAFFNIICPDAQGDEHS